MDPCNGSGSHDAMRRGGVCDETLGISPGQGRLRDGTRTKGGTSHNNHPQTDSQTEHVNQEVEQFLCLFINQGQDDWYNWLLIAGFTYNDQVHALTQTSLFMLDAGQNPQLGFEPICESQLKSLDNFASRMAQATEEAQAALVKAANDMA